MLSAGIVVLHAEAKQWRVLLLRAYRNWDFPKGLVESDEAPLSAAIRETEEETGIPREALIFRWGERYFETAPYAGNKVARYYVAQTHHTHVQLMPLPGRTRAEHHEYRWCLFAEAQQLMVPRLHTILSSVALLISDENLMDAG